MLAVNTTSCIGDTVYWLMMMMTDTAHIIGACGKKWNSPRGGKRNSNTQQHNHITMSLEDVGMHHSLAVMYQVFPVVKRRENIALISKNIRNCTHHQGMWKRVGLTT